MVGVFFSFDNFHQRLFDHLNVQSYSSFSRFFFTGAAVTIVQRQLINKKNLLTELEKDKQQLEMIQKEIQDLESPLPESGNTSQLKQEINQLRSDCERMAAEVEEAGPSFCKLN